MTMIIEIFKDDTGMWAAGELRFQVKSDLIRWIVQNQHVTIVYIDYPL